MYMIVSLKFDLDAIATLRYMESWIEQVRRAAGERRPESAKSGWWQESLEAVGTRG